MALNFPDSPTDGQEYTAGDYTWVYNSTLNAWEAKPVPNHTHAITDLDIAGGTEIGGALADGDLIPVRDVSGTPSNKTTTVSRIIDLMISTGRTLAGAWAFSSTTRPTSAGTGTPGATDLITRNDGDARYSGPKFFAIPSANQTVTTATYTKIIFDTEEFDTAAAYDTSLSRFTPQKAGYYHLIVSLRQSINYNSTICNIYKNGSIYKHIQQVNNGGVSNLNASIIVYANGTTDYFEAYIWHNLGSDLLIEHSPTNSYFSGFYIP